MTDKFSGVVGIPLATPIRVKIGVVWKKGKYISNDMQTLLNFTKNYYKKHPLITEERFVNVQVPFINFQVVIKKIKRKIKNVYLTNEKMRCIVAL